MNKKNKDIWKKLTKWGLLLLLAIFLGASLFLFFFSERWIERELNALFEEKTNDQYSLEFEDLSFNLWSRSIRFNQITVNKNVDKRNTIFLQASKFEIQHINIYNLFANKKLQVKKLLIDSPAWSIQSDTTKADETSSSFQLIQQISPILDRYLSSISIREIELVNAGFLKNELASEAANRLAGLNFNVGVTNFYTDSTYIHRKENYFKADDIFLSINNYRKELADSIHLLSIHKIQYSLKNKDIRGSSIELVPIPSRKQNRTKYFVEIPSITIKSNQLKNIFQGDTIQIDSLFLEEADIRVLPQANAPGINLKQIKEFDLYQLVEGELDQLRINHLEMNARKLKIERKDSLKSNIQEFYDLQVQLDSFLLSKNSYIDPERVLYSRDLYMQIDNYYLLMNDGVHRFDASNIKASSENNFIRADHLQLKPNQNPATNLTTVDMECDSIRLIDLDLKRLFHKREMPLQSIMAYAPILTINQGDKKRQKQRDTNSLLYHFIRNYIKGIYANVVDFNQGRVVINTDDNPSQAGVISSDFSFKLTDFSLDSISAEKTDKLFFATNIDLAFSNYNMKLVDQIHRLKIEKIEVLSYNNQASISNLHLFPDNPRQTARLLKKFNRSQIYDIQIPHMVLRNTNIHQAFFRKKLRINNFSIIEPKIYFEVFSKTQKQKDSTSPREFYELLNNYIENISIGKITAPNGQIQLVTHSKKGKTTSFNNKFSVELENFVLNDTEIEKEKLLFSDNFELKIEDHLFQLSDNVHYLQASEIGVSSKRSEIFIKNAILYPDITSKTYGNLPMHFHVNIPEIRLQGVNLEEAYFDQKLRVAGFLIREPTIDLYRSKEKQKPVSFKKIEIPLPKALQVLSIGQFRLEDGEISIFNTEKLNEKEILTSKINMSGKNNSLVGQGINKPASFESDNISTILNKVVFKPEKGNIQYTADQVHFSTLSTDLQVDNFLLTTTIYDNNQGFRQLKIPSLKFTQLDIEEIINNQSLQFKSIVAENPQISIRAKGANKSMINLYQLKIPATISPLINKIQADQIILNNAQLIYEQKQNTKKYANIYISLSDFSLDTIGSADLLAAKSVKLNLKNYAFSDPQKYYNFNLGEISFSNKNNQLLISNIKINPRYSRQHFQKIIPFQLDHYHGTLSQLKLTELDLKRWYNKNELVASKLSAQGGELTIYRDKTIPENSEKRSELPQDIIKQLDNPIYFDTIQLLDYHIRYIEQTQELPNPGVIVFDQLNVEAFPVTNLPYMLNVHPQMTINANARLMNEAYLETTMKYDMLSDQNHFQLTGHIDPFDLSILNPITENTAGVSIRSGQLNRFEFGFQANNIQSNGKLKFAYDNLKVSILETKDGDTKEAKLASFLTNSLVLKSKHPRTRILLPDEINFKRNPQKSVINYWWKSVFSGAKNTFGIKENNVEK